MSQFTHCYTLFVQGVNLLVAAVEFLPFKRIEAAIGAFCPWQLLPSQRDY
jgi:hypothetical protein